MLIFGAQIGNNLKFWPQEEEVGDKTLALFLDMASSYSSSKLLLGLDTIKVSNACNHSCLKEEPRCMLLVSAEWANVVVVQSSYILYGSLCARILVGCSLFALSHSHPSLVTACYHWIVVSLIH